MTYWRINALEGTYEGQTPRDAAEALARDAGFADFATLAQSYGKDPETSFAELEIVEQPYYQIQVRGDWAGTFGGWRPAVDGSINQTGQSRDDASIFDALYKAEQALSFIRSECDGEGTEFRIVQVSP